MNPSAQVSTLRLVFAAGGLITFSVLLVAGGAAFSPDVPRTDLPILAMTALLTGGGVLLVALLAPLTGTGAPESGSQRATVGLIFAVGLAARLILFAGEPILEVDYNRYLWDGGLLANGHSPFGPAPRAVAGLAYDDPRLALSQDAAGVFDRISYPELATIYPPVAQAWFAIAHLIEPWSLGAWRIVCLAGDIATFGLLLALLRAVGRPEALVVLYWWNPLVLKEVINSAHMEAVLTPLVLWALLLSARARPVAATLVLGLAIGTKLWPVILAPLVLRPLIHRPVTLVVAVVVLATVVAGSVWPLVAGGIGPNSGAVAFASHWTTNSAFFPVLQDATGVAIGVAPSESLLPGRIARLACATAVVALALALARRPIRDVPDLVRRAFVVVSALVLLSPAQFPWYVLWVLPLAVLRPGFGWHLATALLPLYYVAFHFNIHGGAWVFERVIVWAIWVPVWVAVWLDLRREWSST